MTMRNRLSVMCLGVALAVTAMAQSGVAHAARIRGDIVSVQADSMVVHRNSGDTVTVALPASVQVTALKRMTLGDIKPGSFIGTAAMTGVDGKMTATEVHVFPPSARGTGEGHRPFDFGPQSTMTNGNVDSMVEAKDGNVLKLSYKGGSNDVTVPSNVPVVGFIPAARSDLQAGKKVIVTTAADAEAKSGAGQTGSAEKVVAQRILVEKNGVVPPM